MTLLIHPGLPKTGTTWLQEKVFRDTELFRPIMTHKEIFDIMVAPHDLDFDLMAARKIIRERRVGGADKTIDVISSETLSGSILTGHRESRIVADRLRASTEDVKIVITVREQRSTLKAAYIQYIKRGGRKGAWSFFHDKPEMGYYGFDPLQLQYHKLVAYYAQLFGQTNVLVLPLEALLKDPQSYFEKLIYFAFGRRAKFPGRKPDSEKVGASPPPGGLPLLRWSSHFRETPLNSEPFIRWERAGSLLASLAYRWPMRNTRVEDDIRDAIANVDTGKYGDSNKRLQRFSPFNLTELGYKS